MTAEQTYQPQIAKLDLTAMTAELGESKRVEVAFEVSYEVRWPNPCTQAWRLDLGLFDLESTDDVDARLGDLGHLTQEEWQEQYLALADEGHRVFGPEGAVSVLLQSVFMPWSLNKTFGALKLFVAEHYLSVANACNISINNLIYQTIPDVFIEQIIGDGWSFSDYQSDKKKWWKKWRLDLEGVSSVVKSGTVSVVVPLERLESEGDEIAFYDPDQGWQIMADANKFRVLGRLVEVRSRPVMMWSNPM